MNRKASQSLIILALGLSLMSGVALSALPPSLDGTWMMLQVYPRIAFVPMAGPSTQTSYVVLRVEAEQDGLTVIMSDRYCFTIVEESSTLATTVIPDLFMQSLRPDPRHAVLKEVSGGYTLEQSTHLEIRGAVLENPETDELPIDPEDPRLVDQDGDGFPGMTVDINLLGMMEEQIYVVQRFQYELEGTVSSPDRIEGVIRWSDEQVVLEATNPMLLAGSDSEPDPDPSRHIFIMLRAQEGWTCEWMREHWREVFEIEEVSE